MFFQQIIFSNSGNFHGSWKINVKIEIFMLVYCIQVTFNEIDALFLQSNQNCFELLHKYREFWIPLNALYFIELLIKALKADLLVTARLTCIKFLWVIHGHFIVISSIFTVLLVLLKLVVVCWFQVKHAIIGSGPFQFYSIKNIFKSWMTTSISVHFLRLLKVSKHRKQNTKFSHPPKNQWNFVHFLP